EAIVQRDFLPRGSGIVTRRPLVLHLVNESRNADKTEWGEFGHLPGKRFTDFPLIRREIERYTDMEAGSNKGIISKPIFLTIHSPNVVDLILVDLPGLTKVAVGDQPQDIEKQVRELIESYIKEQMTIILAVSPGNVDLANSDALKLAHKWDPEGNRTLGVITKLDLLDQGTDAADMLQNRVIPLRLGYIGLVMRGQKDIAEDKDVKTALQDEETFFRQHYAYQTFANKCGTRFLGKSLSTLLLSHVQKFLPQTRAAIQLSLKRFEEELSRLGGSPEESQGGLNAMMLRIILLQQQQQQPQLHDYQKRDIG
ncbi:MAG: putative Vacuolar protein sorting-associated protein 1, partial [Streblomastix strix]